MLLGLVMIGHNIALPYIDNYKGIGMFITTDRSSYFPIIVASQTQKTRETQEFASRLSTGGTANNTAVQKQTQEFPKGLLQDIENLSNLMLDIDTYTKEGEARGAVYSNNRGNASYVLGGYEYVLSKTDKTATLGDLVPNGVFYSSATNYTPLRETDNEKRYRPFATNFHSRESSIPTETFPEELNRQPDMGYMYADFESNLRIIEKLVDKQLLVEYEKDPRSDETQQLLFLKTKIATMPEIFEKDRQLVRDNIQLILDGDDDIALPIETTIKLHQNLWIKETAMLAEFGLNLNKFLPENEQQQVIDSLNVILNYSDHHWFEGFGAEISSLFKQDIAAAQLKESSKEFQESLISRFSAIDNTEILLNLASDSSLQTNAKESKGYESLIDRIRSKLKGTDDSILQQVMSKITNGVKTTGASGIGEGA